KEFQILNQDLKQPQMQASRKFQINKQAPTQYTEQIKTGIVVNIDSLLENEDNLNYSFFNGSVVPSIMNKGFINGTFLSAEFNDTAQFSHTSAYSNPINYASHCHSETFSTM
uniref:Astacin domain-containing protein n=1 Tax=Rhabditophanes sp. KR3021 TaxID=114890 RepID=A0AC35TW72_9BILA